VIAIVALLASTAAWVAVEAHVSAREAHVHLPREIATGMALLAVHVTAIALRGEPLIVPGLALIAGGVVLRVTAIRALGGAFVSTTTTPTHVIRTGPYRRMRHPSEVGLLAAAVGAAVLMGSMVAAAVVVVCLVPLILVRCAAEDATITRWAR
jgi:protein-S-isoprenylcysteine O-methyltransferase Ste14